MLNKLSVDYSKASALALLLTFYGGFTGPLFAQARSSARFSAAHADAPMRSTMWGADPIVSRKANRVLQSGEEANPRNSVDSLAFRKGFHSPEIDGPSQPEMSSFKSIGANNMVNLFTGDFSYNIPLMDVGGYPINLFYDGGVTMEQEASWVGLGWNINPGNVNRNMRGIPDDFNGTDTLIQTQKTKPNITFGARVGGDIEVIGIKDFAQFSGSLGASFGFSMNNYLGPSLDLDLKGSTGITLAKESEGTKSSGPRLGGGIGLSANSRYGLTFSPNVSLTASIERNNVSYSEGIGLSTSYNSRNGIKALNIASQSSFNMQTENKKTEQVTQHGGGFDNLSASISFARPSYIPSMNIPITNEAFSGHFQGGAGIFGGYGSFETEVYRQTSYVDDADLIQRKSLVGYMYYEKAKANEEAVMDFTRLGDREVTPNSLVISAPQYTYDVFSIQGEGTGGSIRAYRNDYGVVRDKLTQSRDKSLSLGVDIGPPGHYGANFNKIKTPSSSGDWIVGNKIKNAAGFRSASGLNENVYFRNPGESSVLDDQQFDKIGGVDLVRWRLDGSDVNPGIDTKLDRFPKSGASSVVSFYNAVEPAGRKKRTQVINMLTAEEASLAGLDKDIKNYNASTVLDASNNLQYSVIGRVSEYRKAHHISQVNVTEADGKRYIYGVPVYNIRQKDFAFTVSDAPPDNDYADFAISWATLGSSYLAANNKSKDGYLQITETPAYAHSFLLSGLLSPDYVDVTGNGITEDDQGSAVKFNYTKIAGMHKWRTPLTSGIKANLNAGMRTNVKDDKGIVSYGERESWYLHSIESKTMIALFTLGDRADGKGALDSLQGINTGDNTLKRLDKIDLYNKSDLKKNGLTGAKPIKTVWFKYSNSLCNLTPDNPTGGKLTLDSIYFTFNGQLRGNKNRYLFAYGSGTANPAYAANASDKWGTYKPKLQNPGGITNAVYPYSLQDITQKQTIDNNAAAWGLNKVLLPSGGQIEVEYESDDYAYVQNKKACDMMQIAGFGSTSVYADRSASLYETSGLGTITDKDYVFITVPVACNSIAEVYQRYLMGISQLSFKLGVNMPKGLEYVPAYADIVTTSSSNYGYVAGSPVIWIKMNKLTDFSPLSIAAIEYLREQLPAQAYTPGYDVSDGTTLQQFGEMFGGLLNAYTTAFKDPARVLRERGKAQFVDLTKSFVRLNDPDGYKYGGGHRVKSVRLKDNWKAMTGQFTSVYGQTYEYNTTENFGGIPRTISSGVASYEPSIGGEENPFQTILSVQNKLPMGPTTYGATELPILDAFFPAPVVGYSKVTVRSLRRNHVDSVSRSGIGRQVTEFYTAKDFPVYVNQTSLEGGSDKQSHQNSLGIFWYKYSYDSRALSQGFLIETNDMHGKMKSQSSYGAKDTMQRLNYTENFYRNTGSMGLDEKFDFISNADAGNVTQGNMGIDVELMTDTREFSTKSFSTEVQGQVDLFPVLFPFWLPFIWPVRGESENTYRAVTTTKVVNYHSIVDKVLVIDKGSAVTTNNDVYDSETGAVVVNRTNNEFDQPVYTVNYPAYWAYGGMGLAYKNIDGIFTNVNFLNGSILSFAEGVSSDVSKIFESGDEIFILDPGGPPTGACVSLASSVSVKRLWAYDTDKTTGNALTNAGAPIIFIDSTGTPYNRNGARIRIIRSGKRNMLGATAGGLTSLANPIRLISTTRRMLIDAATKVVNANAVEYKEKWLIDNDLVRKLRLVIDAVTCARSEVDDCTGYLDQRINPYLKGLTGNYKPYRSRVYYGFRTEKDPFSTTDLRKDGVLDSFAHFYVFKLNRGLYPNTTSPKWIWNSQVNRVNSKGMELETMDALNIYTAAQYGFNKSTPVAITNNSRYEEMFNEGFEDAEYNESLNGATSLPCAEKHVNFAGLVASSIVRTDTAHTGKYALRISKKTNSPVKVFQVKTDLVDTFSMVLPSATVEELNQTGALSVKVTSTPSAAPITAPVINPSNLGMTLNFGTNDVTGQDMGTTIKYSVQWKTTQYTKITTPNTYSFNLSTAQSDVPQGYPATYTFNKSNMVLTIKKTDGTVVGTYNVASDASPSANSVFLTCDNYIIECVCTIDIQRPDNGTVNFHSLTATFGFTSTTGTTSYKALYPSSACNYNKPIPATAAMLNPTFGIPVGKKMLFSCWVREYCTISCNPNTYENNSVKMTYVGSSQVDLFVPTGPIIEGWQRYESTFTVPAGATSMSMTFFNGTDDPAYFDDIRIHPFNANMKSYVYDPVTLRLVAELDPNNYATFYEFDEDGTLIRTKAETKEGVKTLSESRQAKQKQIYTIQ